MKSFRQYLFESNEIIYSIPSADSKAFGIKDLNNNEIGDIDIKKTPDGWEVRQINIEKPYRRKGYGTKLVNKAETVLGKLIVKPTSPEGEKFWKTLGYKPNGNKWTK